MPSWKTHIFLNILFFAVWLKFLLSLTSVGIFYSATVLIFVIIASVFPDVDSNRSKIRDWFSLLLALIIMIFYLLNFEINDWLKAPIYFLGVYMFLRFFPTPHRTITHTFFICFVFSVSITFLLSTIFLPSVLAIILTFAILFISYSTHLILDKL